MVNTIHLDVIPKILERWSSEDIISVSVAESGLSIKQIVSTDVNMPITECGSTLLHLAMSNLDYPSVEFVSSVVLLLLEMGASPNSRDLYERTPLTNMLTQSTRSLHDNGELGFDLLNLMLKHNANPDVLFTPNFVGYAGCKMWTLAHDLQADMHGLSRWPLPEKMIGLLNETLNFSLLDSEGRQPTDKHLVYRAINN